MRLNKIGGRRFQAGMNDGVDIIDGIRVWMREELRVPLN